MSVHVYAQAVIATTNPDKLQDELLKVGMEVEQAEAFRDVWHEHAAGYVEKLKERAVLAQTVLPNHQRDEAGHQRDEGDHRKSGWCSHIRCCQIISAMKVVISVMKVIIERAGGARTDGAAKSGSANMGWV